MNKVKQFIYENWDGTLRSEPKDRESLIGLPYPYTVPSIKDYFNELYYWDTYFTNVGLILSNKPEYAKNNTSNIAHLINRYGYMPNGNRLHFLNRSQPPFFTKMVRDVYNETRDTVWLAEMYKIGKREYDFWQSKRSTSSGLNRYFDETGNLWENYNMVTGKVSITKEGDSQITMLGWSAGVYLHCSELCGR